MPLLATLRTFDVVKVIVNLILLGIYLHSGGIKSVHECFVKIQYVSHYLRAPACTNHAKVAKS